MVGLPPVLTLLGLSKYIPRPGYLDLDLSRRSLLEDEVTSLQGVRVYGFEYA